MRRPLTINSAHSQYRGASQEPFSLFLDAAIPASSQLTNSSFQLMRLSD
jgi:hypothetical protein